MRHHIAILVMAVTASLGTVAVAVTGQALASTSATSATASRNAAQGPRLEIVRSAPQVATPVFNICLTNAPSLCLESNGAGNQVTITGNQSDRAAFHEVNPGSELQFQNASGNCLRAGTNHVVKIENGPCQAQDAADSWVQASGGLKSFLYNDFMLVHNDVSGFNVWHAAPVSGDWTKWAGF